MESAAQSGDANPGTGPDEHDIDHQRWLELQVLSLTDGGAELAALRGELLEAAPPVYSDDEELDSDDEADRCSGPAPKPKPKRRVPRAIRDALKLDELRRDAIDLDIGDLEELGKVLQVMVNFRCDIYDLTRPAHKPGSLLIGQIWPIKGHALQMQCKLDHGDKSENNEKKCQLVLSSEATFIQTKCALIKWLVAGIHLTQVDHYEMSRGIRAEFNMSDPATALRKKRKK